jgi:hypothetical protein
MAASFWKRFTRLFERRGSTPKPRRRTNSFRPTLLALEDRLVPAGVFPVTSLADPAAATPGTLRFEVQQANLMPGSSVVFDLPGVIHLTRGEIQITADMNICGMDEFGNPVTVTIDGSHKDRIFEVVPVAGGSIPNVTICDLTLQNGYARLPGTAVEGIPGYGGAILNEGNLTVTTDVFQYNWAQVSGGAIETTPTLNSTGLGNVSLTVNSSTTFTANHAWTGFGGAISTQNPQREQTGSTTSVISVDSSAFEANIAALGGGAIDVDMPYYAAGPSISSLTVTNSSFQGNEATDGGGIFFGANHPVQGPLTMNLIVVNSTFNGNDASTAASALTAGSFRGNGGAIDVSLQLAAPAQATVQICGSTFTGNAANFGGALSTTLWTSNSGSGLLLIDKVLIDQDTVSDNRAVYGGGIYIDENGGSVNPTGGPGFLTDVRVTNSTVDDNFVTSVDAVSPTAPAYNGYGGGIYATVQGTFNTVLDFVNDTVAYNSAVTATYAASVADGGGIYLTSSNPQPSAITSLNSLTVAYNYADHNGGGLWVGLPGTGPALLPWVRNCAFNENVAGNMGPDVFGIVASHSLNFVSNPSASGGWVGGDMLGLDCQLDTQLAPNGGPTLTLMPLASSPMIGVEDFTVSPQFDDPVYDQRGFLRTPSMTTCGAVDPLATGPSAYGC